MSTYIQYNSFDINNAIEIVETAIHDSAPSRNMTSYKIARRDGDKLVSAYNSSKEITITGHIQSTSSDSLETIIDNMKSAFQVLTGNLDISYASGTRRYIATYRDFIIQRDPDNSDWCPYSVKFLVPSGKGYSINQDSITYTGIISSNYTNYPNFLGSAIPNPVITITVNSQTALSVISLLISGVNSTALTITKTFNNSDIIVIDFSDFSVKVNGTAVVWTGGFPTWIAGTNAFHLLSTASARNLTMNISYFPSFL